MALRPDLLEILACPQCKQSVELGPDGAWLICAACGLRYPVRDDIPIMLPDEAQPLET
ncbi:MAG: Trm112 family protein [Proteobacteria bacterium]|nr:Trm112 family protein [Pseudomonadota bacterium]MBU1449938.1 Trm112 family protein [Pseudomonadota bacterium]MBU2468058.1 Trm112 family protein [Pseudomonadota bacterium]MBU2518851.1 Trm112 family protein [Pseudomonadota bacterium]